MPYSPDPKSFILDICRVNPRQLVPTVGIRGIGIMNSTTFSLLANNNPEVNGNQEMDLTIGSLNFRVRSSGSTRLSNPAKPDPSGSETKTITLSGLSVGSSSEVNSSVSLTTTENTGEKIKELDETMENLDIGGTVDQSYPSQKDFITRSGGVSSNIRQLCIIITEAADENDGTDNIATRRQGDKSRSNNKKEKEKSMSPPQSGGLSCQPSITARRYSPTQEEKS
jgi:hypothetical protein